MVRLGRINIDHNFGLVQRYRSFVRCRQNAFFMECTAPAIVLVTPGSDGQMQAEAFRGSHPPTAEQIYEWVKRSLPESRQTIQQLQPTPQVRNTAAQRTSLHPPPPSSLSLTTSHLHPHTSIRTGPIKVPPASLV